MLFELRAWLLAIPPTLVALVAREANDNAEVLLEIHERAIALLHEHGIHPLSLKSDGTETERSVQRMFTAAASARFHKEPLSISHCTLAMKVPRFFGLPSFVAQDPKHVGKTARNQILSGARYLIIGCFGMLYRHLQLASGPFARLFRRNVERVEKQDDRAAARTFSGAFWWSFPSTVRLRRICLLLAN